MTNPDANSERLARINALPIATKPAHPIVAEPNHPVELFKGTIEVSQNGNIETGDGIVCWVWTPYPRVEFNLNMTGWSDIELGAVSIQLGNKSSSTSGLVFNRTLGSQSEIRGSLRPFEDGRNAVLSYAVFHLANFHSYLGGRIRGEIDRENSTVMTWAGRFEFEDAEWHVTLDAIEETQAGDFAKNLEQTRTSGFTHVGKIVRKNGGTFRPFEVERLLESLNTWFTICRGSYCSPLLPVGFDENNVRVWENWQVLKASPYLSTPSWFPTILNQDSRSLAEAFIEFKRLWADPDWRKTLVIIAEWYAEANQSLTVDTSIVLNQVGLELLAWVLLVERNHTLSSAAFESASAFERLRTLLLWLGISPIIPPSMTNLATAAARQQWEDGPKAITGLRNATVHPNLRDRALNTSVEAKLETRNLGFWYFELCILKLFNYQGSYQSRVPSALALNGIVKVPWAS
jgi:hypothetical protein